MTVRAAFNQGSLHPNVVLQNKATVPLGADLHALTLALQKQVSLHFAPVWGQDATVTMIGPNDPVPADAWLMTFLDNADAAGALGYHDITKNGLPLSKIFVKDTIASGEKISVTASHEIMEMLIDPACATWANDKAGTLHAFEMCDAVEELVYSIDGITVSDFVYPAFFEYFRKSGKSHVHFDYLNVLASPFQTSTGGYQIVQHGGKISNVFGSLDKEQKFAREDRRGHRSEYRRAVMCGLDHAHTLMV